MCQLAITSEQTLSRAVRIPQVVSCTTKLSRASHPHPSIRWIILVAPSDKFSSSSCKTASYCFLIITFHMPCHSPFLSCSLFAKSSASISSSVLTSSLPVQVTRALFFDLGVCSNAPEFAIKRILYSVYQLDSTVHSGSIHGHVVIAIAQMAYGV